MSLPPRTTGTRIADRALPRRAQSYCGCGEPKDSQSRYCIDCKVTQMRKHQKTTPAAMERNRRNQKALYARKRAQKQETATCQPTALQHQNATSPPTASTGRQTPSRPTSPRS